MPLVLTPAAVGVLRKCVHKLDLCLFELVHCVFEPKQPFGANGLFIILANGRHSFFVKVYIFFFFGNNAIRNTVTYKGCESLNHCLPDLICL